MSAPSAWSKSGDSLAAGCGAVVKVWAGTEPGAEVKLFEGTPVFCLSFSPNNKVLAVGGDKGSVSLYSATPAPGSGERSVGTIPPLPEAGLEAVAALAFLPDTSLVTGGRHGGVHLWALRQHEPTMRAFPGLSGAATALAAPPGMEALAAASSSGQVLLFDTRPGAAGRARSLAPAGGPAVRVLAASTGGLLAAGNDAGGLLVWDLDALGRGGNAAAPASFTGHKGAVTGLAWGGAPHHLLISCGSDGRLRGTDRRTHQPAWSVGCRLPLTCLSVKWDGSLLAVGTAAGSVLVYDARSPGHPLAVQQFSDTSAPVSCVAWQHKYSSRSSSKASAAAAAAPPAKVAAPAPTPPPLLAPPAASADELSPAAAGLTPEASSGSLAAEGCGMMRAMSPVQLYGDGGDATPAPGDSDALHTPAASNGPTPGTSAVSPGAAAFMFTPGLGLPGAWGGGLPTPEMRGGGGGGSSGGAAAADEATPISRPVAVRAPPAGPPPALLAAVEQPAAAPAAAASQAKRNGREAGAGKAGPTATRLAATPPAAAAAGGRGGWNSSSVVQQQPAPTPGGPGGRASRTPGGTPSASRRASRSEPDATLQQQQQGGSGSSSRPGSANAAAPEPLPARPGSAAAAAAAGVSEEVFRGYIDEQMAALRADIKAMHLDMLRSFHQAQMDLVSVVDGLVARQDTLADALTELGAAVAGMRGPSKAGSLQPLGPLPWI